MNRRKYSLLQAIRPKISPKKYRELCQEIEWREESKMLEKIKKEQGVEVKNNDDF